MEDNTKKQKRQTISEIPQSREKIENTEERHLPKRARGYDSGTAPYFISTTLDIAPEQVEARNVPHYRIEGEKLVCEGQNADTSHLLHDYEMLKTEVHRLEEISKRLYQHTQETDIQFSKTIAQEKRRRKNQVAFVAIFLTVIAMAGIFLAFYFKGVRERNMAALVEREQSGRKEALEQLEKNKQLWDEAQKTYQQNLAVWEKKISETKEELYQKFIQKMEELKERNRQVQEKDQQIRQNAAELRSMEEKLAVRKFIQEQTVALESRMENIGKIASDAGKTSQDVGQIKKLWMETRSEMEQTLHPVTECFSIFKDQEQNWFAHKANLSNVEKIGLEFLEKSEKTCAENSQILEVMKENVRNRKEEILRLAQDTNVSSWKKDFESWQKDILNQQEQMKTMVREASLRLHTFHKTALGSYNLLTDYYKKQAMHSRTFMVNARTLQDFQATHDNLISMSSQKYRISGETIPKLKKLDERRKSLSQTMAGVYKKFADCLCDSGLVANWKAICLSTNKQEADDNFSLFRQNLEKNGLAVENVLKDISNTYSKLVKIGQEYTEIKILFEKDTLAQAGSSIDLSKEQKPSTTTSAEAVKISTEAAKTSPETAKTSVEAAKTSTETTLNVGSSKKITMTDAEASRWKSIVQKIHETFSMTQSEFVSRVSIFKNDRKDLTLGTYLISKTLVQKYGSEPGYRPCLAISVLAPEEYRGNRVVRKDNVSRIYSKSEDSWQRISPGSLRFASNRPLQHVIDVMDMTYFDDYDVKPDAEEMATSGESLYRFRFESKENKDFPVLYCWYSVAKNVPLKLEYCTASNEVQITIYCRSFQTTQLGERIQKYIFVDRKNPEILVQIEYLYVVARQMPEYIFQKLAQQKE